MRRRPPNGLIAISPGDLTKESAATFVRTMEDCVTGGGLGALLLREPQLSDRDALAVLGELCDLRGDAPRLWIGIHDRPHLALAAGADGVHLGHRSLRVDDARRVVEGGCAIGLSTHQGDRPARWADADYLFHGPVHSTPSKRGLKDPIGFERLAQFCADTQLPVWAIGGLTPEDALPLRRARAAGPAAIRGVVAAPDPVAACTAWSTAWSARAGA